MTKPVVQSNLHKILTKAQAATGMSSFRALCESAEEETIKLAAKYPGHAPFRPTLIYIRQAIKFKKLSMSQQFIKRALATLEANPK